MKFEIVGWDECMGSHWFDEEKWGSLVWVEEAIKKDMMDEVEWKAVVKFGNPNSNDTWGWHLVPITECYVNREILLWVETELNTVECRVIGNIFDNKELLESEEK